MTKSAKEAGSSEIRPDATISICGHGNKKGAMGAIVVDSNGQYWGLTSAQVFIGIDTCEVCLEDGRVIGFYRREETPEARQGQLRATDLIARFSLRDVPNEFLKRANSAIAFSWPTVSTPLKDVGGLRVLTARPRGTFIKDPEIGRVSSVGAAAHIPFENGDTEYLLTDAVLVELNSPDIAKGSRAGTLVLSESGDAIGLAIALVSDGETIEVVVAPLAPYLCHLDLELWSPPAVHWSDLDHKTSLLLTRADELEKRISQGYLGSLPL